MSTHYQGTPTEIQALDTYIKLQRSLHAVEARITRHRTGGGLSGSQFGTLEMLFHLGPQIQTTIGQKLLTSKSNVVAVIDQLEEQGLVERRRCQDDRRRILVHLTAEGEKLIRELLPNHVAAITRAMSSLTKTEQKELSRLLRTLGCNEPGDPEG